MQRQRQAGLQKQLTLGFICTETGSQQSALGRTMTSLFTMLLDTCGECEEENKLESLHRSPGEMLQVARTDREVDGRTQN